MQTASELTLKGLVKVDMPRFRSLHQPEKGLSPRAARKSGYARLERSGVD
ncbi:hypothetical protein [Sphingomonas oryzagri]|jgi:hypothetical protein|uniref:Transposase n=1 Tax=Sphingomonas oryzagri TaxID=3042314 RepID=A0ABT6MYN7_9SPHN|nr:hypothetical protein [Sphingomonas oryzagri]MDH7638175.1 hypothetical protein [Sphingomonas oryzagri]